MKVQLVLLALVAVTSGYDFENVTKHGKICDLCLDTLEAVKSASTSQEIEKLITDTATIFCSFTPRMVRAKCHNLAVDIIGENFQTIRDILTIFDPPYLCQLIRFCSKDEDTVAASVEGSSVEGGAASVEGSSVEGGAASVGGAVTLCDVCTDTVEEVKSVLGMEELEALVQDVARISCSEITVQMLRDECTMFYKSFVEQSFYYWRIALEEYDNNAFCASAHLCSTSGGPVVSSAAPLSSRPLSLGPLCLLCEDSVRLARHIVTDTHLEKMVNDYIKFSCRFTLFFHARCEAAVDVFTQTLFSQIRGEFARADDHEACVLVLFCGDNTNTTSLCDVCKSGYEEIREVLTSKALQTFITNEAEVACRVYGPFRRICVYNAHRIIDSIFDMLHKLDDLPGEQLCSRLHLCKKPQPFFY